MGKIFPMASLVVRLGQIRKREKEARRAAIAQSQLTATALRPKPPDARPLWEEPSKPVVSGLQRYNARRSREAKRKAEARRVNGDLAVSAAVKDLLKAIQESVDLIARLPQNDQGAGPLPRCHARRHAMRSLHKAVVDVRPLHGRRTPCAFRPFANIAPPRRD